ncbi:hypothetical protein WMW72_21765 [Paenibacillus filicis]|uniref:Uncharacterized protein n=1 Tax=Paenibacillus filicis TaxID=669464 RepID=A0ABU9DNV2_9BACL
MAAASPSLPARRIHGPALQLDGYDGIPVIQISSGQIDPQPTDRMMS